MASGTGTQIKTTVRSPLSVQVQQVYVPPHFADFTKNSRDLLSVGYLSGKHEVKIKARSTNGVYQEYGVSAPSLLSSTKLVGYVTSNWAQPSFDLNSTVYTSPTERDTLTFVPKSWLPAGVRVELTGASRSKSSSVNRQTGSVLSKYSASHVAVSTEFESDLETHRANVSLVFGAPHGRNGIAAGATGTVQAGADGSVVLSNAEVGAHYNAADWQASLSSTGFLTRVQAAFHQIIAPGTSIAAHFEAPLDGGASRTLTVGTSHTLSKDANLKLKASVPTGDVSLLIEQATSASTPFSTVLPRGKLAISIHSSLTQKGGLTQASSVGLSYTAGEF